MLMQNYYISAIGCKLILNLSIPSAPSCAHSAPLERNIDLPDNLQLVHV